jgi:hypothetical protein
MLDKPTPAPVVGDRYGHAVARGIAAPVDAGDSDCIDDKQNLLPQVTRGYSHS